MFAALKQKLFGTDKSKEAARSRLHFVLVQDRTGLTGEEMATFKAELISVINKFFEINTDGLDVSYERDTGTTRLLINSPVLVRRRAGGADSDRALQRKKKSAEEVQPAIDA